MSTQCFSRLLCICLLAQCSLLSCVNAHGHHTSCEGQKRCKTPLEEEVMHKLLLERPPKTAADLLFQTAQPQIDLGGDDSGPPAGAGAAPGGMMGAPMRGPVGGGDDSGPPAGAGAAPGDMMGAPMGGPGGGAGGAGGGGGGGGGGTGAGKAASDECVATYKASGECMDDGSSNFVDALLAYSADTGIFTGTIITNQCNAMNNTEFGANPTCVEVEFPSALYLTTPAAAPGLGALGYSFFGEQVNGPLDAGFEEDRVCVGGTCDPGTDLATCAQQLYASCTAYDTAEVSPAAGDGVLQEDGSLDLLNNCGGHADPLHYHEDMVCHYNAEESSVHSPVVAVMNDGRGLYGRWEGGGELPALDACNGHFGTVPANETLSIESTCVYHYHLTDAAPFTIGCYGPVESVDECKALYTGLADGKGCLDGFTDLLLADAVDGAATDTAYDLWCTCYNHSTAAPTACDAGSEATAPSTDGPTTDDPTTSPPVDSIVITTSAGTQVVTSVGAARLLTVCAGLLGVLFA